MKTEKPFDRRQKIVRKLTNAEERNVRSIDTDFYVEDAEETKVGATAPTHMDDEVETTVNEPIQTSQIGLHTVETLTRRVGECTEIFERAGYRNVAVQPTHFLTSAN
ncbi:MAG: hypothetical protein HYV33_04335 [Candidatus Kerfeldbacteria bacterium]|nr:hypothetical protein [Candidatus Kerfeldbacteria bacterium]